jgi:ribosomal protein S6
LVLMLDPEAPDDQREKIASDAKRRIESNGALKHDESWGMRKMAYDIEQRTEADYRFYRFAGEKPLLDELDHNLKITDGVLRFRIFRVDPRSPLITPPEAAAIVPRPPRREGGSREAPAAAEPAAEAPAAEPAAEAPAAAEPAAAEPAAEAPAPEPAAVEPATPAEQTEAPAAPAEAEAAPADPPAEAPAEAEAAPEEAPSPPEAEEPDAPEPA